VTELFAPVCSIAPTKRRRFLWAAWWSGPPAREPFRKPDASSGGARTREEARREAERAAGRPLVEIEGRWARAWSRVLLGEKPWPARAADATDEAETARVESSRAPAPRSAWAVLGVEPRASAADIKKAFRKRALETHPDRGGSDEAFRSVKKAYEQALAKSAKPARKRR
jgi:hypothetical protein